MAFMRLTASKLPIASACPGSFALTAHRSEPGKFAERGTVIHDFIDRAFREGRDVALAAIEDDELRVFCSRIPLSEIVSHFGGDPRTEVGFAYDTVSGSCSELTPQLTGVLSADVLEIPGWITGKVDGHRVIPGGKTVRVKGGDWKTGFIRVPPALQNLQLRAYAVMLAARYKAERVDFAVVDIDDEGFPFVRENVFEELELDAARTEIREIVAAVQAERVKVNGPGKRVDPSELRLRTGLHCRYCEAFPNCGAHVQPTQALVAVHDRTPTLTPQQLGELWVQAEVVQAALDRVTGAIRFQVEQRGATIPLPTGKVLRAVESKSRTISGKITLDVLREYEMEPAFLTAAKVSFAGIEAACGDRAPLVIQEIEKRKGITVKPFIQLRTTKPKKETDG